MQKPQFTHMKFMHWFSTVRRTRLGKSEKGDCVMLAVLLGLAVTLAVLVAVMDTEAVLEAVTVALEEMEGDWPLLMVAVGVAVWLGLPVPVPEGLDVPVGLGVLVAVEETEAV